MYYTIYFLYTFVLQVSKFIYSMKEENKKFLEWYGTLEQYERTFLNNQIIRSCNVSRATVYSWLKGDRKIKTIYKRIINQLTGIQLFEVQEFHKSRIIL